MLGVCTPLVDKTPTYTTTHLISCQIFHDLFPLDCYIVVITCLCGLRVHVLLVNAMHHINNVAFVDWWLVVRCFYCNAISFNMWYVHVLSHMYKLMCYLQNILAIIVVQKFFICRCMMMQTDLG